MAGAASVGPGGGWRVAGGEQAARRRFGFLRAGPRRFFFWSDFWSERGSPVDCPLSTVHFQRRTRPGTSAPAPPKAADGRELAWSWGRPGTTSGAAAVGMALATRYSGGPGGVGSRSRSWMRQMEVQGSWRCDATGPESPGNGCWCRLLGSPLPECCTSSNWTLRRRVGKGAGPAQQRQGSRGAGRWGHGSPAQRSAWGTRRRTFRAKRAKGQKGLSVSISASARVRDADTCSAASTTARTNPRWARPRRHSCGMRDALWPAVCERAARFPFLCCAASAQAALDERSRSRRPIALSLCWVGDVWLLRRCY